MAQFAINFGVEDGSEGIHDHFGFVAAEDHADIQDDDAPSSVFPEKATLLQQIEVKGLGGTSEGDQLLHEVGVGVEGLSQLGVELPNNLLFFLHDLLLDHPQRVDAPSVVHLVAVGVMVLRRVIIHFIISCTEIIILSPTF